MSRPQPQVLLSMWLVPLHGPPALKPRFSCLWIQMLFYPYKGARMKLDFLSDNLVEEGDDLERIVPNKHWDFKIFQIDVSFSCHPGHAGNSAKQISPKSFQTEGGSLAELGVQHSCSTSHSAETEVSPEMVTRGDRPVALWTYLELTGEVKQVHESYT